MNRPTSLLQRHLLTRADLAELGVPATDVFRWLADGQLEQVGELPLDGRDDPVFTVLSAELRRDLSERLASIDKSTVVMTPLGVRSFLLRALLHRRNPLPADEAALLAAERDQPELDDTQAQRVTKDEIGEVLQDLVVHRIDDDVQTVLQLAAEIAATESVRSAATRSMATAATESNTRHTDAPSEDEPMADMPEPEELLDATSSSEPAKNADDEALPPDELGEGDVFVEIEFDDEPQQENQDLGERLAAEIEEDDASDAPPPQTPRADDDDALGDQVADATIDADAEPNVEEAVADDDESTSDEPTEEAATLSFEEDVEPVSDEENPAAEGDETIDDHDSADAEPNVEDAVADDGESTSDEPTEEAAALSFEEDVEPVSDEENPAAEGDETIDDHDAADAEPNVEDAVADDGESTSDEPTEEAAALSFEDDFERVSAPAEEEAEAFSATETSFEDPDEDGADEPANDESPDEAAEFAMTSATMDRVQDFLGELKTALVEMAQRPAPQPAPEHNKIDVEPLVQAVQAGFERSAEQATQTTTALASLAQRMGEFGERVESGVATTVRSMRAPHGAEAGPVMAMAASPTEFVEDGGRRQMLVIGAVAILVVCWSILFWFKTGSPRLALGTLVGANAVACCLLLARRNR